MCSQRSARASARVAFRSRGAVYDFSTREQVWFRGRRAGIVLVWFRWHYDKKLLRNIDDDEFQVGPPARLPSPPPPPP